MHAWPAAGLCTTRARPRPLAQKGKWPREAIGLSLPARTALRVDTWISSCNLRVPRRLHTCLLSSTDAARPLAEAIGETTGASRELTVKERSPPRRRVTVSTA